MVKSVVCLTLLLTVVINAQDVHALRLALGVNIATHELLSFHKDNPNKSVAIFRNTYQVAPSFSISTTHRYFNQSNIGWRLELNVGAINLNKQVIEGKETDIGTRMTGSFGHFNPTLFYRFGDKRVNGIKHWSITAGMGYGISYMALDGDLITTKSSAELQNRVEVNKASGVFLLPAFLLEATRYRWFARIASCFGGTGLHVGDYSYGFILRAITFGYAFHF